MKTVIIGRFQPLHNGHLALFNTALSLGGKITVVLGSSYLARTPKNPFNADEREQMIRAVFPEQDFEFIYQRDYHNDAKWNAALKQTIGNEARLIAFEKDATSYYLNNFPEWQRIPVTPDNDLSATQVRQAYYADHAIDSLVPHAVAQFLTAWRHTATFEQMLAEFKYYQAYPQQWGTHIFLTADALVVHQNRVLLIRRKHIPGMGLLAMPGGFVDRNERLLDAAIRELKEETGLTVCPQQLVAQQIRDYPSRSLRGRVITFVYQFNLADDIDATVEGSDDAELATWIPISELPALEANFFEDHYLVLREMVLEKSTR